MRSANVFNCRMNTDVNFNNCDVPQEDDPRVNQSTEIEIHEGELELLLPKPVVEMTRKQLAEARRHIELSAMQELRALVKQQTKKDAHR